MWVVLPVKKLTQAKQRLSSLLTRDERQQLVCAMLGDVLDALSAAPDIDGISLLTDDAALHSIAERYGCSVVSEAELGTEGLNASLQALAARIQQQLPAQTALQLLVVHGDLPLLRSDDIQQLIAKAGPAGQGSLLLVPDRLEQGTNALLLSLPAAEGDSSEALAGFKFRFGENSFQRHSEEAARVGLSLQALAIERMGLDIDTPADIEQLLVMAGDSPAHHSVEFLKQLRLDNLSYTLGDDLALAECNDYPQLMSTAQSLRDRGHGKLITYSRKVFIPLTQLCRDVCHYCTFAKTPKKLDSAYMSIEEVLEVARQGAKAGCKEALFTLGERPELRYKAAREALAGMGFSTTLEYVAEAAKQVYEHTGLLPHINAGCMERDEMLALRKVSASMGLMLESASSRLCEKGMPHYGSPDKQPEARLATLELAGELKVPFTTGILIGIGETRQERIESLLAIKRLHMRYGHIQEIIVQNFRAKPGTLMAQSPEPDLEELLWTLAVTRIIFGPDMSVQVPPNLSPGVLPRLVDAGINDWGGVSPVTPDYVNPEAPWPHLLNLQQETKAAGKQLQERLTIYPAYLQEPATWLDPALHSNLLQRTDATGLPRTDAWLSGHSNELTPELDAYTGGGYQQALLSASVRQIVDKAWRIEALSEREIVHLFEAREDDLQYIVEQADAMRQQVNGDTVTYVVNRNINYTNICTYRCTFCAFSKGKTDEGLRGKPYDLPSEEVAQRALEAWHRGATEVCMQGGIHPSYTGQTYIDLVKAVKHATPDMHVHAFSPLEIWQGAETLGVSVEEFLGELKSAGLGSLPGTAAEILHDEVRAEICHDKINTQQWLQVIETAHRVGLPTTSTIMFGHVDRYRHWAAHLLRLRELQQRTGGITEFVPLPFVASESPMFRRGRSRSGPTFREALLMHAVSRIVFYGLIDNIQASWVKMGEAGILACLQAGANDLGGTLMNESITRAAGASHGQEKTRYTLEMLIRDIGRQPQQRSTLYQPVDASLRVVPDEPVKLVDSHIAYEIAAQV